MHEKVQQEQFRIGLEVSFRVILDENTRKHVAIEIELAEPGALPAAMQHTGGGSMTILTFSTVDSCTAVCRFTTEVVLPLQLEEYLVLTICMLRCEQYQQLQCMMSELS